MRFRRNCKKIGAAIAIAATMAAVPGMTGAEELGIALVPVRTIFPGEAITSAQVEAVEVTNPNLTGGYARSVQEIEGMISRQTLLAGRTIPVAALRQPWAVTRGSSVRLMFTIGNMTISAAGTPMQDAAVGDLIRVRNIDSGVIVSGTVMNDGSVQVVAK